MCGINGFITKKEHSLEGMNTLISHRGPDFSGEYIDQDIQVFPIANRHTNTNTHSQARVWTDVKQASKGHYQHESTNMQPECDSYGISY